jgi:diguanylate cyclase
LPAHSSFFPPSWRLSPPWNRGALRLAAVLRLLWLVALLTMGLAARAGAAAAVPVQPGHGAIAMGPYTESFYDTSGKLTLSQLPPDEAQWTTLGTRMAIFGRGGGAGWLRMRVQNLSPQATVYSVLDLGTGVQDFVDLTVLDASGAVVQSWATGDRLPFGTRPLAVRNFAFAFQIPPNSQVTVYARLGTHDGHHEIIHPVLFSNASYASHMQSSNLLWGLYFGLELAAVAFSLLLWGVMRQRAFGIYALHLGTIFLWQFTYAGFAFQYLWPNAPRFGNQALVGLIALLYTTALLFIGAYVKVDTHTVLMRRLVKWLIVVTLLVLLPVALDHYALSIVASGAAGLLTCATLIGVCVYLYRRREARDLLFLLAVYTPVMGAGLVIYLNVLGLLPSSSLTVNIMPFALSIQALLLVYGLAAKTREVEVQAQRAQRGALALKTQTAHYLEEQVKQRTHELEDANKRLNRLSITDELTGVFNRRRFNLDLHEAVSRHRRLGTPVALALLDVDLFKRYNDRYGHLAGDRVLQGVALAVGSHLMRATDHVYRIGGEEFGLIVHAHAEPEQARAFFERITQGIEAQAVEHEDSPLGVITASMGVLLLDADSPQVSARVYYRLTDRLLYAAKNGGRNRLVMRTLTKGDDIPPDSEIEADEESDFDQF